MVEEQALARVESGNLSHFVVGQSGREQVIRQLGVVVGPLRDQSFEIHAGAAYTANGLVAALTEMDAAVDIPARGLSIGKLLSFYGRPEGGSPVTIASPGSGGRRGIMSHEPLREYLSSSPSPVTLGFSDIETIIGRPLLASARKHRAWWANSQDRTLARQWLAAGWRADAIDLSAERVTLIR